jgi:hypothetical protein
MPRVSQAKQAAVVSGSRQFRHRLRLLPPRANINSAYSANAASMRSMSSSKLGSISDEPAQTSTLNVQITCSGGDDASERHCQTKFYTAIWRSGAR